MMSGHVLWTESLTEVRRATDGDERYCFRCRVRRSFEHVVLVPPLDSWYGPTHKIVCSACQTEDADCFPGREREWSDGVSE